MKRISVIVGLCLVAVVAFSAVAAGSASAKEVLFKFTNGNIANGGTFTSVSGISILATANATVECEKDTNEGSFTNAHLGIVTVLFEGCKLKTLLGNFVCTTAGKIAGHITLEKWEFHLGLAEPGDIPAILVLVPGGSFKFSCEVATVTVTGTGVIGALQNIKGEAAKVGEKVSEANLVYANNGKAGEQKYTKFIFSLGGGTVEKLNLEAENSITKSKEKASQESSDTLSKFTNSAKEATELELVEG